MSKHARSYECTRAHALTHKPTRQPHAGAHAQLERRPGTHTETCRAWVGAKRERARGKLEGPQAPHLNLAPQLECAILHLGLQAGERATQLPTE
eukprot:14680947-Alexandrium_andersonii.AAC.1